jgi:uncharacterized protein YfaS (alpha-2-macroglobulin family)/tetratricopeptide (TPR) repeat protein
VKRYVVLSLFALLIASVSPAGEVGLLSEADSRLERKSYDLALESYEEFITTYPDSEYLDRALFGAGYSAGQLSSYDVSSAYYDRLVVEYPRSYWGALAMLEIEGNYWRWNNPLEKHYEDRYVRQRLLTDAAETLERVRRRLDEPHRQECTDTLTELYMRLGGRTLYDEEGEPVEGFDADEWWWENYEKAAELDASEDLIRRAYFRMGKRELGRLFELDYPESFDLASWQDLMAKRRSVNSAIIADAERRWAVVIERWPASEEAYDAVVDLAEHYEVFMDDADAALGLYRLAAARYADTWDSRGDARDEARRLSTPHLQLNLPERPFPTGEPIAVPFTSRLLAEAELRTYALTPELMIALLDRTFPVFKMDDRRYPDLSGLEQLQSYALSLPGEDVHRPHTGALTMENPGPGLYLLAAAAGGEVYSAAAFSVGDLGAVLIGGEGAGYLWVADLGDGTPVAGAEVDVWDEDTDTDEHRPWREAVTGPDGWVSFEELNALARYPAAVVEHEGHYALVDDVYSFDVFPVRKPRGYLITDRTLYKPGDTVFFEILVRREVLPSGTLYGYEPVKSYPVSIEVAAGDVIYEGDLVTDARGRCGASFDIPRDAKLGAVEFSVKNADDGEIIEYYEYHGRLHIEEYVKPEFEVSVEIEPGPHQLGGEVEALVTATYLSGEPVPGGEVLFTVSRREDYWIEDRPGGESEAPPAWFTDDEHWWLYDYYDELYTGTARLGGNGTARIPIGLIPPAYTESYVSLESDWHSGYFYDFKVDVAVSDATHRTAEGSAETDTSRCLYLPRVELGERRVVRGGSLRGTLTLTDIFDDPGAGAPVTLALHLHDFPYSYYSLDLDELIEPVKVVRGATDGDGVFDFEVATAGMEAGDYVLAFEFEDPWGGSRTYYDLAHLTEEKEEPLRLSISTDHGLYAVGDTVEVTVDWNGGPASGMLLVESGGLVREAVPLKLRHGGITQTLGLTGHHAPETTLWLMTFYQRGYYAETVQLSVIPEDKVLEVSVEPARTTYEPGEEAELALAVTDSEGRPVESALTVTVFDRALAVLGAERHRDIRTNFYRDFNYGYLDLSHSIQRYGYSDFFRSWEDPFSRLPHRSLMGYYEDEGARGGGGAGAGGGDIVLREDFRDLALWRTQVRTDSAGRATVSFTLPDDLTEWQVVAWSYEGDRVGEGEGRFRTTLPVIARLAHPRYLTEGDETTLSLVVGNNTGQRASGQAGLRAEMDGEPLLDELREAGVPAGGDAVFDFPLAVGEAGLVSLTGTARTDRGSDALVRHFEVIEHGVPIHLFQSGRTLGEPYRFSFTLPAEIDPSKTALRVWLHPSLASGLKDALRFLQEYPYDCVEQTASRFWTAAVFTEAMRELDVPEQPDAGPVRDSVAEGLTRLYGTRNADGGWPWWAGGRSSDHITGYVLVALHEIGSLNWIDPELESRRREMAGDGVGYLSGRLRSLPPDSTVGLYAMYALALWDERVPEDRWRPTYDRRERLNSYSRALLALFLHENGDEREARQVLENMAGYAEVTDQDAYWGEYERGWYWWQDRVETTALSLKALLTIEPGNALTEKAAHWLLVNRRANAWKSTVDTSLSVWALMDYLVFTGELEADYRATVDLAGEELGRADFTPSDVWGEGRVWERSGEEVRPGPLPLVVEKDRGPGRLYFTAALEYYSKEVPIPAHWDTVRLERELFLVGDDGETLIPLSLLENTVRVGDRIEVVLTVESPNDFDYVAIEDPRVAGCEFLPRERSGWDRGTGTYRELREKHTAFFYETLPVGEREIRYRVRAERPGVYHVLPARLQGMYATDIRANSAELLVTILPTDY